MPTFTVLAAHKTKDVEGQYGAMKDVALTLKDSDGMEHQASWFTKAQTPIPEIGSTVDGTLEPGKFGQKFKKAAPVGGFGGSFRPRDPKESAAIVRQHSQGIAVKLIELGLTAGVVEKPADGAALLHMFRGMCDWLDKDVAAAKEKAA